MQIAAILNDSETVFPQFAVGRRKSLAPEKVKQSAAQRLLAEDDMKAAAAVAATATVEARTGDGNTPVSVSGRKKKRNEKKKG